LLYICVLYRPRSSPENFGASSRPLGFWQWTNYSQYIEFLAGYMYVGIWTHKYRLLTHISVLLTILVLIFGRMDVFVWLLGFFSLGLESTLPLPQLIRLVVFLFKHHALLTLD
jgi:solute carrier family 66, member 2